MQTVALIEGRLSAVQKLLFCEAGSQSNAVRSPTLDQSNPRDKSTASNLLNPGRRSPPLTRHCRKPRNESAGCHSDCNTDLESFVGQLQHICCIKWVYLG